MLMDTSYPAVRWTTTCSTSVITIGHKRLSVDATLQPSRSSRASINTFSNLQISHENLFLFIHHLRLWQNNNSSLLVRESLAAQIQLVHFPVSGFSKTSERSYTGVKSLLSPNSRCRREENLFLFSCAEQPINIYFNIFYIKIFTLIRLFICLFRVLNDI